MEFLSFPDLLLCLSAAQNGSLYSNVYLSLDIPGQRGRDWLNSNTWAYVQDDIKLTPRFTANLAVRYEHIGFFADQSGRSSSFDFTSGAVCGNWWRGSRLGIPEGFTVVELANGKMNTRFETYAFKSVSPTDGPGYK